MLGSFIFQICSLFYISFLIYIYFSKQRLKSVENNIYIILMITTFITLVFDILSVFNIFHMDEMPITNVILAKVFLISLLSWIISFTAYVFTISLKEEEKEDNRVYKTLFIICLICFLVLAVVISVLPIEFVSEPTYVYSHGLAAQSMYIFTAVSMFVWVFRILFRLKYVIKSKCTPIIVYIIFTIIGAVIQFTRPEILIVSFFQAFVTFITYYTIENPDLKLINELNIAMEQADKANNAKTEFLSSMSHEIRTPLNAIVGFSQSISESDIPDTIRGDVNDIVMASQSLLEIVNGVLDISKIEANKLEIINTEYNFKKVFDELVALTKGRLGEKPLEFKYSLDPSIPQVLFGDYVRVKQVILNLLTNAVKYTENGRIEFNVNSVIKDDICRLIVSVEDTGIGIKKEQIDKLFQKFERVNEEEQMSIEGTGLGLAITKKLVDLMGGSIVVQSEFRMGSRFTMAIDQRIVFKPSEALNNTVSIDISDLKIANKKVLIVDDNKINLKVASRLLKSYNITAIEVDTGQKCIDLIKCNEKFDLIFMDDMMPRMSGIETFEILKKMDGFNTPTIALTANAISGMKEKYLALGFDDYLPKPIDRQELNRVVKKFLDK